MKRNIMKRACVAVLAIAVLFSAAACAQGYNSFMQDSQYSGRFSGFAWNGEYVYWLHAPQSMDWEEHPANLYRMRPGDGVAQLLLEGGEKRWMSSLLNIGDRLLISVSQEKGGSACPALINLDGSGFRELSGNIGSCVLTEDTVFNSADGGIYRIGLKNMKPKRIYTYPKKIAAVNPCLVQYADGKLYFVTDAHEWYELDEKGGEERMIAHVRGDGFIYKGGLYISDYDAADGTWRYDLESGTQEKVSENNYTFLQGSKGFVLARQRDASGPMPDENGVVFDFMWLTDYLEDARIGSCDGMYDFLLDGRLVHYDWENNRVEWSEAAVVKLLK